MASVCVSENSPADINAEDVHRLQDAVVYSVSGLMLHTKTLTGMRGCSEPDMICEAVDGTLTKSAVNIYIRSQALDELLKVLNGGVEMSVITEKSRTICSGKPQLAGTPCISTQLNGAEITPFQAGSSGIEKLSMMQSLLGKLALEFDISIFLTNGGEVAFVMSPRKPTGANVRAHESAMALIFRKGHSEQPDSKMLSSSPTLNEAEMSSSVGFSGSSSSGDNFTMDAENVDYPNEANDNEPNEEIQGPGMGVNEGGGGHDDNDDIEVIDIVVRVAGHNHIRIAQTTYLDCMWLLDFGQLDAHIRAIVDPIPNPLIPAEYRWILQRRCNETGFLTLPITYGDVIGQLARIVILQIFEEN